MASWDDVPKADTFKDALKIHTIWIVVKDDPTGKSSVWVSREPPMAEFPGETITGYRVETNLSYEDFELGKVFKHPSDWLRFAKKTKKEVINVGENEEPEQLEFVICNTCNTMAYPDSTHCPGCGKEF